MAENSGDLSLGYMMGQSEGNSGGFGGNFGEGLWAVIILAILFGRGGFGGGGFGGFGGGGNEGCCNCATQADVRAAVDQQTLISKLDQQTYGLADTYNALNNTLNSNFRSIDNAICTLGYQGAQHASNLSAQLASCCCDIERGIERNTTQGIMNTSALQSKIDMCCCDLEKANMQNRFDAQTYNCNTLQAIDKLGDRIIDRLNSDKMDSLMAENQSLRLAASQSRQNQYLIDQLRPCPVPAYSVPAPFYYGYGNNGCGCGCG